MLACDWVRSATFAADRPADPLAFTGQPLVELDDFVEDLRDIAGYARPIEWQAHAKIPRAHAPQGSQKLGLVDTIGRDRMPIPRVTICGQTCNGGTGGLSAWHSWHTVNVTRF
jgi:hypothetical protein